MNNEISRGNLHVINPPGKRAQGGHMGTGSTITLAPLLKSDIPALFTFINDRESVLFNSPYRPVSEPCHEEWFESITRRKDMVIFGIRLMPGNELIGTCQLHSIHPVHRSAELQIRIGTTDYRGKGYGTEATRRLLDIAFRDLNLNRVYLQVFSTNKSAIRIYEKAGFSLEGTLRQAAFIDGKYLDILVMGLLKDDYGTS
jgi:RimJ/RimL family protein N-acetyltransferase